MNKLNEVRSFLSNLGMPEEQQSDLCCVTILAMANIKPNDSWKVATNGWIRIHDIIAFAKKQYDITYAENSRETFRKKAIHHFRNAAIIEDNGMATNSPNYGYRITNETLSLLQTINSDRWYTALSNFMENHQKLIDIYASKKQMQMMPVKINYQDFTFSPGKHNALQKAILEKFAPRFAPNAECLYVGDTTNKDLVKNEERLRELGFEITLHDKMPDVVLYCDEKAWIFFIEAVTSIGPMSPKRMLEIAEMTKNVVVGKVYVTAFPDFETYKKFATDLAWETEVWIANAPDHMIHLNGDKFLGPR